MRRKLGFFTLEDGKNKSEDEIFYEALKDKYSIGFFNWKETIGKMNIKNVYPYSGKELLDEKNQWNLRDFNLLHVLGMGKFGGREKDVVSFFHGLENLEESIIINKPKIMLENLDKSYLLYLQDKGVKTIPTIEVNYGSGKKEIAENFSKKFNRNIEDIVLKPKIFGERSNSVVRLSEISEGDLEKYYSENKNKGILSQEFISTINKDYERSLVYMDKKFSHAILRYKDRNGWLPPQGNQGRSPEETEPTKEEKEACEKIFKIKGKNYTHLTRFDFLGPRDSPLLSEVEEINPAIHLDKISEKSLGRFIDIYRNFLQNMLG